MGTTKNPFSLEGKTILVTGASSGIGKATAITSAEMGAKLICVARDATRLEQTLAALPEENGPHKMLSVELTDNSSMESMIANLPIIDGLVLCAGKGLTLPVQFCDREHFDEIFNLNFFSTVEIIRLLYKKKSCQREPQS